MDTKTEIDTLTTSIKFKLEYLRLRDGQAPLYIDLWRIGSIQVNTLDDLTYKLESLYTLEKSIEAIL